MGDDTIEPVHYRRGRGGQAVPFGIAVVGTLAAFATLGLSGPYLWPWGLCAGALVAAVSCGAWAHWWNALETICWDASARRLDFVHRFGLRSVFLEDLTEVRVVPSAAVTYFQSGTKKFRLSHRLVSIEALLDLVRLYRPDLFDEPTDRKTFRCSLSGILATLGLAAGTALAGSLLCGWVLWVGQAFLAVALVVLIRALVAEPLSYTVSFQRLEARYPLRRRIWKGSASVVCGQYAAGGVSFFTLTLGFRSGTLVLDEGRLTVPLRPVTSWVAGCFEDPGPG